MSWCIPRSPALVIVRKIRKPISKTKIRYAKLTLEIGMGLCSMKSMVILGHKGLKPSIVNFSQRTANALVISRWNWPFFKKRLKSLVSVFRMVNFIEVACKRAFKHCLIGENPREYRKYLLSLLAKRNLCVWNFS